MKRTDNSNSALPKTGTKTQKAAPAKASKPEISAKLRKKTAPAAEKPLEKITAKPAVKASAPLPKTKKSLSSKSSEQENPTARKKSGVPTEVKNTKNSKRAIIEKAAVSTLKPKKSALSVEVKPKNKKDFQTAAEKTAKPKQILPAVKKTSTASEKKAEVIAGKSSQKNIQAAAANKAVTAVISPKSKTSGEKVSKKAETVIAAKNQNLKTKSAAAVKKAVIIPATTNQKVKVKAEKTARKAEIIAPVTTPKLKKKVEAIDKKTPKGAAKKIEQQVEIVVPPVIAKPVKKKLKPIGSAVVRGKSGRYDFEVFPLDADLKDGSAIYVISKRITDKSGRGHHKFVCIGQTESLIGEIKRHKKDKCIKQHKANVICLLREESAANRLKIETDLREAHSIVCNQK